MNSPFPCVIPRSWDASGLVSSARLREGRTAEHVVQTHFRDERKLLVADLRVDNRALALVDTANHSTWGRVSE